MNLHVRISTKEFLFMNLHVQMSTKEFLFMNQHVQMTTKGSAKCSGCSVHRFVASLLLASCTLLSESIRASFL